MASENKIVLIGDPEVGKTSIFTRFKNGHFSENVESQTRKEADCKKSVKVDGKEVEVSIVQLCTNHVGLIKRAW